MTDRDARAANGDARDASGRRKRKMTVSAALEWAWRDELPKMPSDPMAGAGMRSPSAWASILAFGEVGTIVDRQPNRYGCIPFDQAGWPHPDALELAHAVESLADCAVDVPEGWHPMPELTALDDALAASAVAAGVSKATAIGADGALHFRVKPDILVVRHAILGKVPDWRMSAVPEVKFEAHAGGRHKWFVMRPTVMATGEMDADGNDLTETVNVELDGWSSSLRRPVAGAYRKPYFEPDPVPVMVARAEYEIFSAAMCMLFDDLDGRLASIDLVPVDWPVQPWASDDSVEAMESRRAPRILPDLTAWRAVVADAENAMKSKIKPARKRGKKAA